jgi:WD40 repeat protein
MTDSHGRAMGLSATPFGSSIIVGDSRHARRCDAETGRVQQTFATGLWSSFVVSNDHRWLYGLGEPGLCRWLISAEGIDESSRKDLQAPANFGVLSMDESGQRLGFYHAGWRGVSLFHDLDSSKPKRRDFPLSSPRCVSVSPDGRKLAACGGLALAVWDLDTGQTLYSEKSGADWVEFDPKGEWLVVGRANYEVYATSTWTLKTSLPSPPTQSEKACAVFSSSGDLLATGHGFGQVSLWSSQTWKRLATLESPSRSPIGRIAFDREARKLLLTTVGGVVEIWNLEQLTQELRDLGLAWDQEN